MKVAMTFYGDSSRRSAWSGTPRSLADAIEGLGFDLSHVSAVPRQLPLPGRLRHRLDAKRQLRVDDAERAGKALGRRLKREAPLDGIVQIGTEYLVPAGTPLATFEDMTVAQARALDHPLLADIPTDHLDEWVERQRQAYERAEACCVTTAWVRDSIVADYGIDPSKIHVVGLGRNLDPKPVERDWSQPRFLFVGQDWPRKNGAAVVHAFGELRKSVPDATLTLLGNCPPVDAPGVRVHEPLFLNHPHQRKQMEQLFESATCLVLPSLIEPSAIVHLEAAAAGVPSIGTAVGGVSDLVGDSGRLVDPHDPDALLSAMLELADGATASRLGAAARQRGEWYTWPKTAERIVTALGLEPPAGQ